MKNIKFIVIIALIITSLESCREKRISLDDKKNVVNTIESNKKDTIYMLTKPDVNSEGAFIFNSGKDILINWTEWYKDSKQNVLKFAFFDENSQKFSTPIAVTPSKGLQIHAESMAKVGITSKGILYAVFRVKSKSRKSMFGGTVYYTISSDKGLTWSPNVKLVADKNSGSQSFFDIALLPDGELGITWLDSRMPIHKGRKGKTLYFAKTNSDRGFYGELPIAGSTCECCRTEIYIDQQKKIHIAYRNIIEREEDFTNPSFTLSNVEIRDMYYVSSQDNGTSFSEPIPISKDNWQINGCPHTGPSLAQTNSNLAAVWFTGANNSPGIFFSTYVNEQFTDRKFLSKEGLHPQMTANKGKYYIVYEEYYELEDKGYTKIMLETIESTIENKISTEISDPKTNNNHVVISSINQSIILTAWVNANTRNPKIKYKLIHINK